MPLCITYALALLLSMRTCACDNESCTSLLQVSSKSSVTLSRSAWPEELVQTAFRVALEDVAAAIGVKLRIGAKSPCPRAPHKGKSKSMSVAYEVRNGVTGMGVFLLEPVKKGQKLWGYQDRDHLIITKSDEKLLRRMLSDVPADVAKWFLRWTYVSALLYDPAILFEFDDGRFTNNGNGTAATAVSNDDGDLVASRDLKAGTEILEDYEVDSLDDGPDWWKKLQQDFDPYDQESQLLQLNNSSMKVERRQFGDAQPRHRTRFRRVPRGVA